MSSEIQQALDRFGKKLQKIIYNSEIPFPTCGEFPHQEILTYFTGLASITQELTQQQQNSNNSLRKKIARQNRQLKEAVQTHDKKQSIVNLTVVRVNQQIGEIAGLEEKQQLKQLSTREQQRLVGLTAGKAERLTQLQEAQKAKLDCEGLLGQCLDEVLGSQRLAMKIALEQNVRSVENVRAALKGLVEKTKNELDRIYQRKQEKPDAHTECECNTPHQQTSAPAVTERRAEPDFALSACDGK